MNRALLPRHLKFRPLVATLALAAACAQAQQTLPTGLQVAAGQASAQAQGGVLTVTNSANAILNWQSFSIGAQNAVRFVQPSASSQVLNRVTGSDPSAILGSLSSNGRVWLLNPNGVLFGQGARVDVAGLVASTLNIANEDWLAGRYLFGSNGAAAPAGVVNQGELRTSLGGRVALVGGSVENQGLVEAPGGQVLLAAGRSVELVDTGAPNLAVRITAPQGEVLNLGTLSAAGGRIDVHGAAVNQQGLVRADSLSVGPGGEIVLQASERLTLAAGSITSADAAAGQGGQVQLLGREVALLDGAAVSASGRDGGGAILAGGGAQGRDASLPNAQALFFGRGASLSADALDRGDGGHIVLWSDQATRAFGALSARGGARAGNGGLVETSGGWLDARPARLDVGAPRGRAGTWLLDPYDITISDAVSDGGFDASFAATGNDATISSATLTAALTAGTNVTVSTGTAGTQAGNITVTNATISPANAAPVTLTLQAAGDIVLDNAQINDGHAPLNVTLQAAGSGVGAVSINSSYLSTLGGNITIGGPGGGPAVGHAGLPDGVKIVATGLSTDMGDGGPTGDVSINGRTAEAGGRGVFFTTGATSSSNFVGTVNNFSVTGSSTNGRGVEINDLYVQQAFGTLAITGTGTDGLYITNQSFPQVYFNAASVTLTGNASGSGYGLYMSSASGSSGLVNTSTGDFQATGRNTAGGQKALLADGGGTDMFAATGNILLAGYGGGTQLSNIVSSGETLQGQIQLFSDSTLTIDSSYLNANTILARSPSTLLLGTTTLYAAGSGNAILIEGPSNDPLTSFDNKAGSGAFGLDPYNGGRWLIWSMDPAGSATVGLGGLAYDFQRYSALAVADAAGDAGNGVISFKAHYATMDGSVATRAYDGTTAATLTNLRFSFDVTGDAAGSISSYTADFASKDVGTRAVSLNFSAPPQFMDAGGHPIYGYTLQSAASGSITPALLSGSVSAASRVYDATSHAAVSVSGVTGFVGSETVGVTATGSFSDKNVGTAKTVTAAYQLSDGANGGLASNYQFQPPAGSIQADITRAPIAFSATAQDKVYDAQLGATLANVAITPLGSDQLTLNPGTASFADKNVGTAKPVGISGASLSGTDAGNYTLSPPTGLTASITPAALNFTATAQNRAYDGTTTAQLTGLGVTPLGSDQVTLNAGTAAFVDKNAGTAKPVGTSGFSLSGPDAGNYLLAAPVLTADITPAVLSGSVSAASRAYDATTHATVSVSGVTGFVGSETVGVAATGNFSDPGVGAGKLVAASYQLSDGSNGGLATNYRFQPPAGNLTASITPATLTYLADPVLLLSGAPFPAFSGSVVGLLGSDTLANATTGTAVYQPSVASSVLPGTFAINGSGLSAANYVFVQDSRNAQALVIVPGVSPAQDTAQTGTANMAHVLQAAVGEAPALSPVDSGLLDLTAPVPSPAGAPTPQTVAAANASQAAAAFGPQAVGDMSADGLASLLALREAYKKAVFAEAIQRLEQDPGLADLPLCRSLQELAEGKCLLTEALKRQAAAGAPALALAAAPQAPQAVPAPAPKLVAPAATAPVAPPQPAAAPTPAAAVAREFAALGPRHVRQAALPQINRKMALLIGASTYQDPRVPSLANAVGDVRAVGDLLENELGYQTVVVENANRASVVAALNQLALEAGPHDSVVVYYAGHGELVEAKAGGPSHGYWQLVDSRADQAETWLSNGDIARLLGQIGASQVALISDSCYSGALASGERLHAVPGTPDPAALLAHRSAVVMSSGGNEPVFDSGKGGHSPFAWNLMATLRKMSGWQPGGNVFERVRFGVARELPQRPQYAAAAGHQEGGDYLFERRQLDAGQP